MKAKDGAHIALSYVDMDHSKRQETIGAMQLAEAAFQKKTQNPSTIPLDSNIGEGSNVPFVHNSLLFGIIGWIAI